MEEQILSLTRRTRSPVKLPYGLGVADYPFDGRGLLLERSFKGIDVLMNALHAQLRVNAAMKVDNFALAGLPYPHIVHVADVSALGSELR